MIKWCKFDVTIKIVLYISLICNYGSFISLRSHRHIRNVSISLICKTEKKSFFHGMNEKHSNVYKFSHWINTHTNAVPCVTFRIICWNELVVPYIFKIYTPYYSHHSCNCIQWWSQGGGFEALDTTVLLQFCFSLLNEKNAANKFCKVSHLKIAVYWAWKPPYCLRHCLYECFIESTS